MHERMLMIVGVEERIICVIQCETTQKKLKHALYRTENKIKLDKHTWYCVDLCQLDLGA